MNSTLHIQKHLLLNPVFTFTAAHRTPGPLCLQETHPPTKCDEILEVSVGVRAHQGQNSNSVRLKAEQPNKSLLRSVLSWWWMGPLAPRVSLRGSDADKRPCCLWIHTSQPPSCSKHAPINIVANSPQQPSFTTTKNQLCQSNNSARNISSDNLKKSNSCPNGGEIATPVFPLARMEWTRAITFHTGPEYNVPVNYSRPTRLNSECNG